MTARQKRLLAIAWLTPGVPPPGPFGQAPARSRQARKGWRRRAPKGRGLRRRMPPGCFLLEKRTKRGLAIRKFPVCDRHGRLDCQGLLAAHNRAAQYGYGSVARKARALACRLGCTWTRRKGCPR